MKEIYIANKEKEYDEFSFTTLEEYSLSIPNVYQVKSNLGEARKCNEQLTMQLQLKISSRYFWPFNLYRALRSCFLHGTRIY